MLHFTPDRGVGVTHFSIPCNAADAAARTTAVGAAGRAREAVPSCRPHRRVPDLAPILVAPTPRAGAFLAAALGVV